MKTWIPAVLLLFVSLAQAGDSLDPVLDRLAKIDRFAFGGTGYAGVISEGQKDYRRILSRPSAEADFEKLLAVGNAQAKSYALVGIHTLAPGRFKQLSRALRDPTGEVVTQSGCIVDRQSFRAILKQISAGKFSSYGGAQSS